MSQTLTTHTGLDFEVRPARPGDVPLLMAMFDGLSPASRFQRFNRPLDDPSPESVRREAERLLAMGPEEGRLWIASVAQPGGGSRPIAVIRYNVIPPDVAEVGLSVGDAWQRQGVGSALLRFVVEQAAAAGIRLLSGLFRQDNPAVRALLRDTPVPLTLVERGDYIYVEADIGRLGGVENRE